jgi:pyruvate,water dikinase
MMKLARFAWRHARLHHEIRQFLAQYTIVLKDYRSADWRGADTAALIAALDRLIGAHAELSWCNFMAQINMMGRNRIVDRWVKRTAPGANPGDLVRGLLGLRSLEPNTELRRLALLAQSVEPEIRSQLLECSNEHSRRALLSDTTHGAELLEAVERFMATFGHLSANGSDFSETPWVEMPALIWQAILRAAEQEPSSLSPAESSTQAREAARVAVRTQQTLPERWLFDRLLVSTVAYIDLRELVSDATSQGIHQMRRILLALAEALVRRDALRQPGHLFYLNYDEVRALADGSLSSSEAQARCSARMAEIATDATVDLPPIILGDRIPVRPIQLAAGQRFLAGIGGSSGCVRGIARVVMDPANAPPDLGRGDILVVPFTDVGWTPLFPGIGGIVAETGGRLSHTSIVAREYGLPAVVSVHQATHLLTEGQPITLDGDAGRVYLEGTLKEQENDNDAA